MAAVNSKSSSFSGLKPVIILSVVVVLLLKSQRASALESQEASSTDTTETPFCPDYCNLAPDRATRGKAPFRMWYYDVTERGCKRFRWSGRGGNKNRFIKKADCEEICSKCTLKDSLDEFDNVQRRGQSAVSNNDTICSQPIDEGRCEAESQPQLVWHFNKEKAKCSPFIFYGCGKSPNRFESKDECEELCH